MKEDKNIVLSVKGVLEELSLLKNIDVARRAKAYHKSNREHWGVTVPDCEKVARAFAKEHSVEEMIVVAKALWDTNLFDPMTCASKMLSFPKVKPSKELWDTLLYFLQKVDGWALEDGLCHVAWKCILANENYLDVLEGWTKNEDFWMRRAALVYTLPFAKKGKNPERPLQWASAYSTDPEWFIQKAIGWWLRVLGEHNPERVVVFLKVHWEDLKRVARYESTRKLSEKWTKEIL